MRPSSFRARLVLASLGLAAAAALAACSGGAGPNASGPGGAGDPAGAVIAVTASDYAFDPSAITVAPGTVTFRVENAGAEEHEFEIFEGEAVVDEIEGLVPGLTKDLTVTLDAGTYTFVCKLADHEQRGMTGTLTVAP
jgi:iron uptake system component EfeO